MAKKKVSKSEQDGNGGSVNEQIVERQKALFALRMEQATNELKDYSKFKKLRREIARLKTNANQINSSKLRQVKNAQ